MQISTKIHIWVSIAIFFICLSFPGYYFGEMAEEKSGLELLLIGWLGSFFWYANLFYFLSLFPYKKTEISSVLSVLSLLIAISFLGASQVPSGDINGGGNVSISGYGIGYFLWVLSIGIFTIGQILPVKPAKNKPSNFSKMVIVQVVWILSSTSIFIYYYKFSQESVHRLLAEREELFINKCEDTDMHIYEHLETSNGVLITINARNDNNGFNKGKDGSWYRKSSDILALNSLLGTHKISFYERIKLHDGDNKAYDSPMYTTTILSEGDYNIGRGPNTRKVYKTKIGGLSAQYKSDITLTIIPEKSSPLLNIYWANIKIVNNKSEKLLAETSYAYNANDRRLCAATKNGRFSPYDLLSKVYMSTKS